MGSSMTLTEKVKVISVHGEMLNVSHPGVGHALPLSIDDGETGTVTFKYVESGQTFNRHVPLDMLGDFRVGQILTQVIS